MLHSTGRWPGWLGYSQAKGHQQLTPTSAAETAELGVLRQTLLAALNKAANKVDDQQAGNEFAMLN